MSAVTRIVFSLVALSCSFLLLAGMIGFFPDHREDVLEGRMRLCESMSLSFATLATDAELSTMERLFRGMKDRNPAIATIGLRRAEGILLLEIGGHEATWKPPKSGKSSETHIIVPVDTASARWGAVEVRFHPITKSGLAGLLQRREVTLTAFMAVAMCLSYYLYLRRVLRQLNPSKVIPGRVKEAFDSLAEGILVMDSSANVILANRAFEQATGQSTRQLLGRPVDELPFSCRDDDQEREFPWHETIQGDRVIRGRLLGIQDESRTFSVSSTPIIDERGENRGVLASFEDVTQLRNKKEELTEMVRHLHESSAEIRRQNHELEQLANFDPLTGCHNRRSFFDKFDTHWKAATRYRTPITGVMVDIDHFKSINDNHGHQVGDEVLRKVARCLQSEMRESDLLCRYGGEEFAILLPQTELSQGFAAAERYREAIASLRIPNIPVTASLGVSSNSEQPNDPQELLDQADKCLYVAKRNGRNRVIRFDEVGADDLTVKEGTKTEVVEPVPIEDLTSIPYHAVTALVSALGFRDQETATHSRQVADLCVAVAEGLLSHQDCYTLEMAALLHDIGKIGVPDAILMKPDKLSPEEWEVMHRSYSCIGVEIVHASFASAGLTEIVRTYRMRYDSGKGRKIPVAARILAIADAYDSMTNFRVYRRTRTRAEAIEELRENAGGQFDPELVERFVSVIDSHVDRDERRLANQTADIALNIGIQIERLVAALDAEDLKSMSTLSERLYATANKFGANEIGQKAVELQQVLTGDDCDLIEVMQIASELLDLCRSTQSALLVHG